MRKTCRWVTALLLFIGAFGAAPGLSQGADYEVWQCGACGEFNCQGYATSPMLQFYPYGHKIGDLYRINLDATQVLAVNPAGAGYYGYMMWRMNNAPILWLSLDNAWGLIDWDILYNTCSYQVETTVECVDFEDPAAGTFYAVGDFLADSGQTLTFTQFQWSNGTWYSGGYGQVETPGWCNAGGTGQNLVTNNVNVQFAFPTLSEGVVIHFGEYGGNVNIEVNGDFRNASNFGSVVSPVGGVALSCAGPGCTGGGTGTLYLTGTVTSLSIGGQEFCVDDVCPGVAD